MRAVLSLVHGATLTMFDFGVLEKINGHDGGTVLDETKKVPTERDDTAAPPAETVPASPIAIPDSPPVEFTIVHNKDKHAVSMPLSSTIGQLKDKLVDVIGVPSKMQKIMIKGLAKDEQTLESLSVSSSSKIMVVGAKLQDIVAVSVANIEEVCVWTFIESRWDVFNILVFFF